MKYYMALRQLIAFADKNGLEVVPIEDALVVYLMDGLAIRLSSFQTHSHPFAVHWEKVAEVHRGKSISETVRTARELGEQVASMLPALHHFVRFGELPATAEDQESMAATLAFPTKRCERCCDPDGTCCTEEEDDERSVLF